MDHLLSAESVIAEKGSFWGALNHAAMVHRLQAPLWILCSLSFCLAIYSDPCFTLFLLFLDSVLLKDAHPLCHSIFVSAVCLQVRANLRGRVLRFRGGGGDSCGNAERGRRLGGKRLLFVWTDAQTHLWTSVSDQRSRWCRTDSWAMSYQPLLRPSSIILSLHLSHSDDGTLNKVH